MILITHYKIQEAITACATNSARFRHQTHWKRTLFFKGISEVEENGAPIYSQKTECQHHLIKSNLRKELGKLSLKFQVGEILMLSPRESQ